VRAAERCLELARAADELLVLVSGGASALVCAPSSGVMLATKRAIGRALLLGGASIQEINIVRKHLSRIKGGALARACPGRVRTLIASDVIGGAASDVGSGPSVSDASTVRDARRILARHAPHYRQVPLVRTGAAESTAKIIASPEQLARAMAAELRAAGLRVRLLPASQARATELAAFYAAAKLAPGEALVRAAEPSVEVIRPGRGGRSTHLATLVGRELAPGHRFLAFASDGVDGASGTGGALVGPLPRTVANAALARFATGTFLLREGYALPARPTGHNLADLHVLVRE
jgi:hydroxypyruvate reductase